MFASGVSGASPPCDDATTVRRDGRASEVSRGDVSASGVDASLPYDDRHTTHRLSRRLRSELGDPQRATSIPAATAKLLDAHLDGAARRVARAVDAAEPDSELGRFLAALRADHAQWREANVAANAKLSDELAARHREV